MLAYGFGQTPEAFLLETLPIFGGGKFTDNAPCKRRRGGNIPPRFGGSRYYLLADDILKSLKRPHLGMKFHSYKRGLTAFLSYLTDFVAVPELWDKSDSETTLNAPWILSRAMLLLSKTSLRLDEVWNMPLGELLWYCAVFAEQEGVAQIQSDEERRIIEEVQNGVK